MGGLPRTRRRIIHVSRNLSRALSASLRDRLRRPRTEPASRQVRQQSGSGEGLGRARLGHGTEETSENGEQDQRLTATVTQQQQPPANSSDRWQRITLARSAPTGDMPGLKSGRSRISAVRPRLLPILLPSRWTRRVPCGQLWNVGPAHGRRRTALDDAPTPTDQMLPERARARCVPDRAVNGGNSRPARSARHPSWGGPARQAQANDLLSSRSLGAPQRSGVWEKVGGRAGNFWCPAYRVARHETAPGYRQWMRARRRLALLLPRSSACRSAGHQSAASSSRNRSATTNVSSSTVKSGSPISARTSALCQNLSCPDRHCAADS